MTSVCEQAAKELLSRRTAGTKAPRLIEPYRPISLDDALAIQESMIEIRADRVGGWKCLLPLAENKFIVAPIFADNVQQGEVCELFADTGSVSGKEVVRVEPEIAFVLAKPLPANSNGYSKAQINDAIGSCHMALELIQSRFADDSGAEFYEVLADCLANQGLFLGPEIEKDKAFTAAKVEVAITQAGKVQALSGTHPNALAQNPVYWLSDTMTKRGVSFEAGEAIITGSYCGVVELDFDELTTVAYDGIGEYQVTFTQKR